MSRLLNSILVLLALLALYQFIRTGKDTVPSRDLVLDENSMLLRVNEDARQQVHRMYEDLMDYSRHAQSPVVLKAREQARKADALTSILDGALQQALLFSYSTDSVKNRLREIKRLLPLINESGVSEEALITSIISSIDEKSNLEGDQATLALLFIQNDVLFLCRDVMQKLSEFADSMTIKFSGFPEKQKAEWVQGMIVFNAPAQMNLGQKTRVQVRISKRFEETIKETMRKEGSLTSDTLSVGDIMMVKLLGDEFEITSFDDEEQGVTEDGYTQWEFDVMPLSAGDHELFIKAGIIYYVPNLGPTKKYFPVYEKKITVHVSVWQQVAGFAYQRWEFIVSSILIPAGVWLITRFRHRKREKSNPSE